MVGYSTADLADIPLKTKVQLLQYKLQLKKFYRENPDYAPLDYDWLTHCAPSDVYLNLRLGIIHDLIGSIPLQEHTINFSRLLTTSYNQSGTIFPEVGGFAYFAKPIFMLSASLIDVVVDDVVVDATVDTIVGGLQGAFVFFETIPITDIDGVVTQTIHIRANLMITR